jgi:outer membrane protein assembly factor BamB
MGRRAQDAATKPVVVERAPLDGKLLPATGAPPRLRLALVSQQPNKITDEQEWLKKNGLTLPFWELPSDVGQGDLSDKTPLALNGCDTQAAFRQGDRAFLAHSDSIDYTRYLSAVNPKTGEVRYLLDFSNVTAPRVGGKNRMQPIVFAQEDANGTLYVSHAANGYAKESRGKTGYVTAVAPQTGKILWRSVPLVANAKNFLLLDNVIVCGYGFTAEPDYLFVLDRATGRTLQRIPIKTGPEYILRKGDRLYVRCYDTNYIFAART